MRYRLRTLLILLALRPPLLAGAYWAWPKAKEQPGKPCFDKLIDLILATTHPDSWEDVGGPGAIDEFSTQCFFVVDAEENCDGPDPCGRSYSYTPYAEFETVDEDGSSSAPPSPQLSNDPFAL